jgi:hypothetical protein
MRKPVHDEAIELLLASMSQKGGEGVRHSFVFGKPGAPPWDRRMGADLSYRRNKLIRASVHVRQNGPAYLKYLPIGDIWSMLQNFISENYWYLFEEIFLTRFEGSYAEQVSSSAKVKLAIALAASEIFQPRNELTLFPIVPVQVKDDFDSESFFLIQPGSFKGSRLPSEIDTRQIAPDLFPPLTDWKGRREVPGAWLGVRSPAVQASKKMKTAILGALALTPLPHYRYLFSGRKVFGGRCTITDTVTTSFGQAHTPPLMHDIIIGEQDRAWLKVLASKLMSNERAIRRQLRALEYFCRAWELDPSERFPILCMTLDAIFGDANHATQAVIDGVRGLLGSHVRDARLRQLMDLRASVIHGGAPDVYDSRKYGRYYDDYEADPIHDLELVVASCLRLQIFGDAMKEHEDPNAKIIAEAQAKGRLPKDVSRGTILEDVPAAATP